MKQINRFFSTSLTILCVAASACIEIPNTFDGDGDSTSSTSDTSGDGDGDTSGDGDSGDGDGETSDSTDETDTGGTECESGAFCDDFEFCNSDGICQPWCSLTEECSPQEYCDTESHTCQPYCFEDSGCDEGFFCNVSEECQLAPPVVTNFTINCPQSGVEGEYVCEPGVHEMSWDVVAAQLITCIVNLTKIEGDETFVEGSVSWYDSLNITPIFTEWTADYENNSLPGKVGSTVYCSNPAGFGYSEKITIVVTTEPG